MILLLTTADTEVLATARALPALPAGFPGVRASNPVTTAVPAVPPGGVVLVRLLGGRAAWPEGFDRLAGGCAAAGVPLLAFGGEAEPDAELAAASTVPADVLAAAFAYLRHGGVGNLANLFRFLSDRLLGSDFGHEPPAPLPDAGLYRPELLARHRAGRPTVGVVFYRAHWMSGNTAFVDTLVTALDQAGANPLPLFCYSLRPGAAGHDTITQLLTGHQVDALVTTVLATTSPTGGGDDLAAAGPPIGQVLDVPVVQGICCTGTRDEWLGRDGGLTPLDAAMQVAIPEFDGRLVGVPFSFKEPLDGREGAPLVYRADPERAARLAAIATRLARLRHIPNQDKRVAIVLSSYPTKHARVGNAVGLDTPASAVRLLEAMRASGYDTGDLTPLLGRTTPDGSGSAPGGGLVAAEPAPATREGSAQPSMAVPALVGDGDLRRPDAVPTAPTLDPTALVHALLDAGGYDREFLTAEQLAGAAARADGDAYAAWFARLEAPLREGVVRHWGEPPGDLYVDGDAVVLAGLRLGNVFLAIQPPRGFGENPVAIYHDPDLPPSHHYLAAYWWLDQVLGADAIVHLGKHGTLEWLPGKGLALSAACAPDAVLGAMPLVYPFIVNDPGEGTQAKRRAHATVVDHLIPPMQRAETYDELARLEQLLDEYAQVQALDPAKLPALRARIWELVRTAELHRDLGVSESPEDAFDTFVLHLDGYLCEIKDARIKDGLHVLGEPPRGPQRLGLVAAILRLGSGDVPGLRTAVAAALGMEDPAAQRSFPASTDAGSGAATAPRCSPAPTAPHQGTRWGGPRGGAVLGAPPLVNQGSRQVTDRLEAVATELLGAMDAKGWDPGACGVVVEEVLGRRDRDVERVLEFAARQVVPRLERTRDEIDGVLRALEGRHVPAGPSGSPTRGMVDVLPTGRNFYSVDPKALPSELAMRTGERLAADLLRRYLDDEGAHPEAVGIVVWGTAAMRTSGDDVGEVLSLLGVRPRWQPETRRVTGLDVVPLADLGRPRIDVTVRISGFFRDAFPNLVTLLDDAVTMVAGLDEPDELNFVAKHARADRAAGAGEREATTRIFGSKPGAYGAGLLPLIDARNWEGDGDLARVWGVWGGYAYGRGLDGTAAVAAMEGNLARIRVAVKNVDTDEHDLLDSDDYFQYHGGMVAAARALTGTSPRAYVASSADPERPRTRSLAEEVRRVVRSRVLNPRWVGSLERHGYKGAFELSATVDYLFGYDATTGVVEDWVYEAVSERYVLDEATAAWVRHHNPWALRAIAERLLEAADRKLWEAPDPATLDRLRAAYLDLEGDLEERGDVSD